LKFKKRAFFIYFRSSTGKSTLIKQSLAKLPPDCQVYLFNVRADEVDGYSKTHSKVESVQCSTLKKGIELIAPNSVVILEDIITLKKKDEENLRLLLNYKAHHDLLRIVCVGHMLFRNSLLTLIPLFNYIIFTLNNAGRSLIRQTATYAFNLDKNRQAKWVELFSKSCLEDAQSGRSFCFVDCSTVNLYLYDRESNQAKLLDGSAEEETGSVSGDDASEPAKKKGGTNKSPSTRQFARSQSLQDRFASCFSEHDSAPAARALFSILSDTLLQESSFRSSDLTVAFSQNRKPGKIKRISVVDYVSNLLEKNPRHSPPTDYLVLHRYFVQRCKIPKLFVKNCYYVCDFAAATCSDEHDDDGDDNDEI